MRRSDSYLIGGGATKAIPLNSLDRFFPELFPSAGKEMTPQRAYSLVSYVYRALNIRADAFVAVPWTLMRGESEVEIESTTYAGVDWDNLLWRTEAARMMWGASYWLKVEATDLQWLNPKTMKVKTDPKRGIIGFVQRIGSKQETYKPEEIVYLPTWNPDDDLGPGIAPAHVALDEAGLVANADLYLSKFFEHGAIPAVILSSESMVPDAEIERIRTVWQRLYSGVTNAWRTAVLRKGLTPTVVGHSIKDLAFTSLMETTKQQIAVDFGISVTLLDATASNYATAKQDDINLYTKTVFPDQRLVASAMNKQLWAPFGLKWVWREDQVEAIQADEAEKAQGLARLLEQASKQFEGGILTRDRSVWISEQLWDQMGLAFPDDKPDEEPEEEEPEPEAAPQMAPEVLAQQQAVQQAAQPKSLPLGDLRKWARKAKKRQGACEFESTEIPDWAASAIKTRLDVNWETAFDPFLKATSIHARAEGALLKRLIAIYADWLGPITDATLAGNYPDLEPMYRDIRSAAEIAYQGALAEDVLANAGDLGWGVPYEDLLTESQDWATAHADGLIEQVSRTDRKYIEKVQSQIADGKITPEVAQDMLARSFGKVRAGMIASTEVTAAMQAGSDHLQADLEKQDIETVQRWLTEEDERVCPICGPLDHTTEDTWRGVVPGGPPAHVNCRCETVVELVR